MEFWRIYRLLYAKRWLILATVIIAALVILVGTSLQAQKREYEAIAILQPQNNTLPDVIARTTGEGAAATTQTTPAQDSSATVSDVIMILRSSNDLYNKTADLLREDETARSAEVERILDRNAYFSSVDNEIQMESARMVSKGEMPAGEAPNWITKNKQAARKRTIDQLAKGRDASGAFGETGVALSEDEIADRIREKVTFDTVPGPLSTDTVPVISDQVQVTAKFDREAESVLYVNLLCVEFLDYYTNQRTSAVNARIAELNQLLTAAQAKLKTAKDAETEFRKTSGVLQTTQADATINRAQLLQTQRDQAERDYRGSDAAVSQLQSALSTAQPTRTSQLPASENPEVRTLRTQVDEANLAFKTIISSNEGAANNEKYIIAHARLIEAQNQLAEAQKREYTSTILTGSIEDLTSRLNQARVARGEAEQHLNVVEKQIEDQHVEMAKLPAAENRLSDLRREINLTEQNVRELETTVQRQQAYAVEHGRAGTINIVSAAHPTPVVNRIAAQRGKLIVYGMALALFFGIVLVVAMDALDNSIRTSEDVEKLTGLPVAGIIPAHLPDPIRSPRVALIEPMSAATEAYRMLRTYLLFTDAEHPFSSLLMATAKPGQGSTTTLCNLAIVLAQSGKSVILVDADLRQPKLNRIFKTSNDLGLTSLLMGNSHIDDCLLPTEVDGLRLLPAGPFVNHPSELLGSPGMHSLHEHLKSIADFVLFDTPSAIAYADTAILSSFLDATLMVVKAEGIPRETENQVQTMLLKAKANLIGAVLNGVVAERVDSVHFHDTYYPALTGGAVPGYPDNNRPTATPAPTTYAAYGATNGGPKNGDEEIAIALRENSRIVRNEVATTAVEVATTEAVPVEDDFPNGDGGDKATMTAEERVRTRIRVAPGPVPHREPTPVSSVLPNGTRMENPGMQQNSSGQNASGPKRSAVPVKVIILVIVAGLVLGVAVLLLSSGANVK